MANKGYLIRNINGVKEIRVGDVQPPFKMTYSMRHTGGALLWSAWWEQEIAWKTATVIPIHPGLYWAFPEEDGKIEFALYNGFAIPTNIAPIITEPKGKRVAASVKHIRYERMLFPLDGGYRARRNAKDGGL